MSLLPNATSADNNGLCYFIKTAQLSSIVSTITSTINGSVSKWSLSHAVSDVNVYDYKLLSTTALQVNDQYITATNNSILLNGVPIVTDVFSSLSSITEWSYYAALSTVDMNSNIIEQCTGINLNDNLVTTDVGNTIKVNGQNPVATWSAYNATGNLNMATNNINNVNSLSGINLLGTSNISQSNITNYIRVSQNMISLGSTIMSGYTNVSTLFTSTIDANVVYAQSTLGLNAQLSNVILSNATNRNTLTTTGASLLYNGAVINTGAAGNVALWSQFDAVSLIRNNRGYANQALEMLGKSYFNGDVQFRQLTGSPTPSVEFDRTSAGGPYFKINNAEFRATGGINRMGNSNTYATQNYIYGGTTIDGGNARGCSIGCLPVTLGVNTCRIDVLPIGILITTPTTVGIIATSFSFNVTAFANLAAEAYLAMAAGTYMTLEHGFQASGQNGIFVQCTARNDTCRLTLEFGGSVGPSVDYPTTPAKVNYHGENFYIKNITNAFAGGRWPLSKDVFIDSVSTLKFVNGAGLTVSANSTLSVLGTLNLSTLSVSTVNAYNVSTVNLSVESVFAPAGYGAINFYENITATKNIACYSNITAPYMATSTIYGTSGATINGNLWLETPLVTATNNLRVTNTLFSDDARFIGQTTVSSFQSFVGEPITFNNQITNLPNSATISSLSVSTINGIQMPNIPIQFNELTVPRNVWSVTGAIMATQTITITSTSRIWALAAVEYNNTGSGGANNFFIDTWIQIGTTAYSSTRTSIPDRFTPTIPSSTNITVQQVLAALPPGTYTLYVYAAASAANTDMTCTHCDFVLTAGYF